MLVGRRDLDQGDIDRKALGEEPRDLGEKDGRVIGPALVHGLAQVRAHEERVRPEGLTVLRPIEGSVAERQELEDLHIAELLAPGAEGQEERPRNARVRRDRDAVAALHEANRVLG